MADNSLLSAGPNSILSLDRFEFDATTSQGQFDAQLRKGSLAVISGRIAKQSPEAMTVRTPSAISACAERNSCCPRMTRHLVRALLVAAFSSMVASCAIQSGTVVLLPDKDGKDTALTVTQRGTKVTLAEPYSGTKLTNEGPRPTARARRKCRRSSATRSRASRLGRSSSRFTLSRGRTSSPRSRSRR
jgi:hypothetical protein